MTNQPEPMVIEKKRKSYPWKGIAFAFMVFALIVLIFVFYSAYFYYLKLANREAHTKQYLVQTQENLNNLERKVQSLTNQIQDQTNTINSIRQTQTCFQRDEWRVYEAEFLVKLANDKLQYENNTAHAILLLQAADQQIRDLNDASLLPLRKALAEDIANLQSVPSVDVAGIYARLSALNEQINKLPLQNKTSQSSQMQTSINPNLPWWKRGLEQTWATLQKIVTVRYNQEGRLPLVTP
ncbi:MAG TPA: uroporphyrinogen-III C-methyltransferase, partial [Candidatus Babeliaceae bacterium]|nr:uroporphyrinogen-III C-methyltransferase [Candidatus Babeliaceae bacterium]